MQLYVPRAPCAVMDTHVCPQHAVHASIQLTHTNKCGHMCTVYIYMHTRVHVWSTCVHGAHACAKVHMQLYVPRAPCAQTHTYARSTLCMHPYNSLSCTSVHIPAQCKCICTRMCTYMCTQCTCMCMLYVPRALRAVTDT